MLSTIYQWGRSNRVLLTNAGSMMGTTAVTAGFGFLFWWFAAKYYTTGAVGFSSAAVAAMLLLGNLGMLGLGTSIIAELKAKSARVGDTLVSALVLSGVTGTVLGILFALIARYIAPDLAPIGATLENTLLFALGVSLTSITLVLDQALVGLLLGGLQLWRNAVFAVGKLILLILAGYGLATPTGFTIYGTWLLGNGASVLFIGGYILLKRQFPIGRPREVRRLLNRTALSHHLVNVLLQAPGLVLPVIAVATLSVEVNAHFYIAWMLAGFLFIGPFALSTVLYAITVADPASLGRQTRLTLRLSFLLGLAGNVIILLFAREILLLFGTGYANEADWALRLLALGVFGTAVKDHYVAIYRTRGQILYAAPRVALGSLIELILPAIGASLGGLRGLTLGWLIAILIQGIYLFPPIYALLHPSPTRLDGQSTEPLPARK